MPPTPTLKSRSTGTDYEVVKERSAARARHVAQSGRDIGKLPSVVNRSRKRRSSRNFRLFCEKYFPRTFTLAWSPDHLKVIARIKQAVLHGGLFAMAMPRGSGKTSIAECACLWAVLYGHRNFVCLIGASEIHAQEMLSSIKMELESNDLLAADFPEVTHPIHSLDGIANRCAGQLHLGHRTHIVWTATEIVLPTIPRSKASAAIIKVAGITGRIRGMKFKRPDGRPVRPSLALVDDPQTDESARSPSQSATRASVLAGAVLGLAGPGEKISGIMPCTVIHRGDMADTILDTDTHPEWNGHRSKMVYAFPTNEALWGKYALARAESLRTHGDLRDATAFYTAHRKALDKGAKIAWPERFNHDETSAIQHAMNLKYRDETAFFAEYQNEPLPDTGIEDDGILPIEQIAHKINGHTRRALPIGSDHLTAFIDIQGKMLFYLVAAWSSNFTGHVVDYGSYPDQKRPYFSLRDAKKTLQQAAPGAGQEGSIYAGLEALTANLLGREWRCEDGARVKIDQCLIDANWGFSTNVVKLFCRQSTYAAILTPSHGRYVGASSLPYSDYRKKRGDRLGLNWRIPSTPGHQLIRHVLFDTNFWKSFVHSRLATPMGDIGCLSLFGNKPAAHRLLAEHLTAEYRVRTEGRGRVVDEWKIRPNATENHWFDCLVGAAVAASMQGVTLASTDDTAQPKKSVKLSDLQRTRR